LAKSIPLPVTIKAIRELAETNKLPSYKKLEEILGGAVDCMEGMVESIRPKNDNGRAGGLIFLQPAPLTLVVTDLHARKDYLLKALEFQIPSGKSAFEGLQAGEINLICLGDAFHGESRARLRWQQALDEYSTGYKKHKAMDQEMEENLHLIMMIALLKQTFPNRFFFLKGNHENIANERGEGNYPFRKYAFEGEMVKSWVLKFMGDSGLKSLYLYEKALPLGVRGPGFLVTHAEPGFVMTPDDIRNCYLQPEVIYQLTWTNNDQAEEGSVSGTLENFFGPASETKIFGGHRPVKGKYDLRQDSRYVQFNRPDEFLLAIIEDITVFDPESDIIYL
jgi:hypothetical protein